MSIVKLTLPFSNNLHSITINLCLTCLIIVISVTCYISPMRFSHISNQHLSLGKLSQVIRTNPNPPYWTPITASTSPPSDSDVNNLSSSSSLSSLTSLNSPPSSSLLLSSPPSSSVFSSFLSLPSTPDHQSGIDDTLFFTKNTPEPLSRDTSPHGKSGTNSGTNNGNNHRHHNHHQHHSSSSNSQRGGGGGQFNQPFFYESPPLKRFMLRNKSVTCNDGTKAGYYFRSSLGYSKRWIVFLEGGWYCFSPATCHQRWLGMRNLMTSAHWPQSRSVGGILSPNPQENPYFWNANHVFVPYCSSDSWSGDSPAATSADLSFLGSRIVIEVIGELLNTKGLSDGKSLLLAGSSAGAGGVLVNLDRVANLISSTGSKIEVRGLMDSGWFLDNQPFEFSSSSTSTYSNKHEDSADSDNMGEYVDDYTSSEDLVKLKTEKDQPFSSFQHSSSPSTKTTTVSSSSSSSSTCTSAINCSPIESIKQGMKLWNGKVPESCRSRFPDEPWRCYFGYRLYPTLRTPLFVFQWIFDEAQMIADNVGAPISKAQWNYIHQMGQELRNTLSNVSAYFAPSCISHIVLTKPSWNSIKINGTSLPQAIRCWELHSSSNGLSSYPRRDVITRVHKNQYSSRSQVSSFVADEFRPYHHRGHNNRSSSLPSITQQSPLPLSSSLTSSSSYEPSDQQQPGNKRSLSPTILIPQFSSAQSPIKLSLDDSLVNKSISIGTQGSYNLNSFGGRSFKRKSKRRHKKHKKRQQEEMIRSKRLAARQELLRLGYQRPHRLAKNTLCRFNHIDSCSWPQCNSGCPKLHNPFTGEEVNFLELLKSYGFNLMAVAQALGMETKALNEMEDGALFQLFHRKVS